MTKLSIPPDKRVPLIRPTRILAICLSLYVASYVALSASGEYLPAQSGEIRWGFGLSATDIVIWKPRMLEWKRYTTSQGENTTQGNAVGYFYSPLLRIDRAWIHPTRQYFEETTGEE